MQALARNFGGPQAVIRGLVAAQSRLGMDVTVLTTNVDAPAGLVSMPPDRFVSFCGGRARYSSVQVRPLLISADLTKYLSRHLASYDIVHIHELYRFPQAIGGWYARRTNVPYIVQPHGCLDPYVFARSTSGSVWLKRTWERLWVLPTLRKADAILYTTPDERDKATFLGLTTDSFVLPNGLDWELYDELPSRGKLRRQWEMGDRPIVLFVGRIHPVKGLDVLVAAFSLVHEQLPAAYLVIAGPDNNKYGPVIRAMVNDFGLQESVKFVGALSGEDVRQAYVDADVFALPSYSENFGMAAAEAMACGLPVVISDRVKIQNDVAEAGAGIVTRTDPAEVAVAILTVLNSHESSIRLGAHGRSLVRRKYVWPAIADELALKYAKIIELHSLNASR